MSGTIASGNPFAALQPQASAVQAVPSEVGQVKNDRNFSVKQQLAYEERVANRAAKAAQEAAQAAEAAKPKPRQQLQLPMPRAPVDPEIFQVRKANRAAQAAYRAQIAANPTAKDTIPKSAIIYTKMQTEEYEARKAERAANKAAFEERQAKREERAAQRAAYEARVHRREEKAAYEERKAKREERAAEKAAYEEREAKRQERNKKEWIKECLRLRACFNCGSVDHYTNDCQDPPYAGKY